MHCNEACAVGRHTLSAAARKKDGKPMTTHKAPLAEGSSVRGHPAD